MSNALVHVFSCGLAHLFMNWWCCQIKSYQEKGEDKGNKLCLSKDIFLHKFSPHDFLPSAFPIWESWRNVSGLAYCRHLLAHFDKDLCLKHSTNKNKCYKYFSITSIVLADTREFFQSMLCKSFVPISSPYITDVLFPSPLLFCLLEEIHPPTKKIFRLCDILYSLKKKSL